MTIPQVLPPERALIGIGALDCHYPLLPGNVANADSYDFPVRIRVIEGLSDNPSPPISDAGGNPTSEVKLVIDAVKALEAEGVRAIVLACGFFSLLQNTVAAAVRIPVFSSPLMLIPFVNRLIHPDLKVGVMTAAARRLTPEFLTPVGVDGVHGLVIAGMDHAVEFNAAIMENRRQMDAEKVRAEVVAVARELVCNHPEVGAILLECSDMPPYAADIQSATGLPVFDYLDVIRMLQHVLARANHDSPL